MNIFTKSKYRERAGKKRIEETQDRRRKREKSLPHQQFELKLRILAVKSTNQSEVDERTLCYLL